MSICHIADPGREAYTVCIILGQMCWFHTAFAYYRLSIEEGVPIAMTCKILDSLFMHRGLQKFCTSNVYTRVLHCTVYKRGLWISFVYVKAPVRSQLL